MCVTSPDARSCMIHSCCNCFLNIILLYLKLLRITINIMAWRREPSNEYRKDKYMEECIMDIENGGLTRMEIATGLRAELNDESGWGFEISKVEGTNEIIVQTVITNSAGISVNLAYLLFTDLEGKDKVHLTVSSFDMRKYNPDVLQVVLEKGANVDFVKVYRADDRFGLSYITGVERVTGDITYIYDTMIGMLDVMGEYLAHAR